MEIPCDYVFKKGTRKGNKCSNINCKLHINNVYAPEQNNNKIKDNELQKNQNQENQENQENQNAQETQNSQENKVKGDNIVSSVTKTNLIKADAISSSNIKKVMTSISNETYTLENKILNLDTTIENKAVIIKHMKVLKKLDFTSSEYYKNQLFIENAMNVPWNKYYNISEKYNDEKDVQTFLKNIKDEFDREIYGMENIKNEIINYVCKLITNPFNKKNSLALYGNAGVCKTKFIKVLSKVLNLPLKVISLGGVKDSSYFLGHNFTYVESNYGAIMGGIVDSKIMNPILYFDELDKVSQSETGRDIYSVLSNLTDPTINSHFTDHYFRGMTFDLSKVFYIFTFNDINKIDKVLLDRLNVIYINSPTKDEKCKILKDFCIKDIIDNIGIKAKVDFDIECFAYLVNHVDKIINHEVSSGIRECIRILEKILLQINKEILLKEIKMYPSKLDISQFEIIITLDNFKNYFEKLKTQFYMTDSKDDNKIHYMYC